MNKRIVGVLLLTLLLAFGILFWLQISYYNRVLSIRKEQTCLLAKDALNSLVQDVELREKLRYLRQELYLHQVNQQVSQEQKKLLESLGMSDTLLWGQAQLYMEQMRLQDSFYTPVSGGHRLDSIEEREVDKALLGSFLFYRKEFDKRILQVLYNSYECDSIPRLLNAHYIKRRLRKLLDEKGVCEAFRVNIYDTDGHLNYTYTQPGMLRVASRVDNTVRQQLFANEARVVNVPLPSIEVTLDFVPSRVELMEFALPGIISTVVVLFLSIFATGLLIRQLSFQSVKDSFINNMTHEFKTPVASISLAAQSLREARNSTPEFKAKLLSIIDMETKRLRFLIDKVLQFSLLDGKTGAYTLKVIDLNEVLLNVSEIASIHAERQGGSLTMEFEADNTWVEANTLHLTNALFNILDNATKYARKDEPLRLVVRTSNEDDGTTLRLEIQDNGIGIPRESLSKIFERYYRVPTGYKHEVRGFGLGLSYVRSVIQNMGGKIFAQSALGEGTVMVITFPTKRDVGGQLDD